MAAVNCMSREASSRLNCFQGSGFALSLVMETHEKLFLR